MGSVPKSADCWRSNLLWKNQKQIPTSWLEKQKAGKDWMCLFFQRHPNLSLRKGESCSLARAMCFNQPSIQQFFDNLDSLYTRFPDILQSKRVYNLDETATTTVQGPQKIIAAKGQKQVSLNASGCADGTFLPPVMVFPRVHFKNAMLLRCYPGTLGLANPSGWMNNALFFKVLQRFIKETV